jgi:hypothetical protein
MAASGLLLSKITPPALLETIKVRWNYDIFTGQKLFHTDILNE